MLPAADWSAPVVRQQDCPSGPGDGANFPRLSINHLLLLTLTISFALAYIVPQLEDTLRTPAEVFRGRKWQNIASLVAKQMATGVKLFGFIVLVRNWSARPRAGGSAGSSGCSSSWRHWQRLSSWPSQFPCCFNNGCLSRSFKPSAQRRPHCPPA